MKRVVDRQCWMLFLWDYKSVSYTHLRAHETDIPVASRENHPFCCAAGNVGLLFIFSWYDNILAIEIATSPFYGAGHDAGTILGFQRDSGAGFEFFGEEGDKG